MLPLWSGLERGQGAKIVSLCTYGVKSVIVKNMIKWTECIDGEEVGVCCSVASAP